MLKSWRYGLSAACLALSITVSAQTQGMDYAYDEKEPLYSDGAAAQQVSDPWEGFNRASFAFNEFLDKWILRPVAKGYVTVTPDPVEGLVSNFFTNLSEIRNVANSLLQLKLADAGSSTGRFLVNSTIGMLGLIDVGTALGWDYKYNDFGMTLANWSVPAGPYVVVPFLGPRTVQTAAGIVPDAYASPITYVTPDHDRYLLSGADVIRVRAELRKKETLIVGDKYSFIRDAYLQRREFLSSGRKVVEDEF